jgi:Fe-S cluster assembly ATP-binding protein
MSVLRIEGLRAGVSGHEILHGVDLEVGSGRVEAVMGPNGSGKSTLQHVLMGRPGYTVTAGSVTLDGEDLLALPTHERAARGLFAGLQYPVEVPGVAVDDFLRVAVGRAPDGLAAEAGRVGLGTALLDRALNVGLSGGEKKRLEAVQLAVLRPKIAVLDELDSGLDVDALRDVTRRVEELTHDPERPLGVLVITHYSRLFAELRPDRIHVFIAGRIVESGGAELADELERTGYDAIAQRHGLSSTQAVVVPPDPFDDPGF